VLVVLSGSLSPKLRQDQH